MTGSTTPVAPQELPDLVEFALPPELEADAPPEARGLGRDQVRLMVSNRSTDHISHSQFSHFSDYLCAGDVLVINTSKTINAALPAVRGDGRPLELHLSTRLPTGQWTVEFRQMSKKGLLPFYDVRAGEQLRLPGSATIDLIAPYKPVSLSMVPPRLWLADLHTADPVFDYLDCHGFPIRYDYVHGFWPLAYYQTAYATEPGSAEMPSAGRAFTPEIITRLVAKGVWVTPLVLHTGVSSVEGHEPPYDEYYRVSPQTAQMVNMAKASGHRVIAVGTTVIRALETVTGPDGNVMPGEGWTGLVIMPEHGIQSVTGLLTGFHEPHASHLAMLEALVGRHHLQLTYKAAVQNRYLWHEFGDLHLLLP